MFCHNILGTMIQVIVSTKPSNLVRPRLENTFFPVLWIFFFFKSLKQRIEKGSNHYFPDQDCLTTSTGVMAMAAASIALPRHVRVQDQGILPSCLPPSFNCVPLYFSFPRPQRPQNIFKSIQIKNSPHIGHLAVTPLLFSNL